VSPASFFLARSSGDPVLSLSVSRNWAGRFLSWPARTGAGKRVRMVSQDLLESRSLFSSAVVGQYVAAFFSDRIIRVEWWTGFFDGESRTLVALALGEKHVPFFPSAAAPNLFNKGLSQRPPFGQPEAASGFFFFTGARGLLFFSFVRRGAAAFCIRRAPLFIREPLGVVPGHVSAPNRSCHPKLQLSFLKRVRPAPWPALR